MPDPSPYEPDEWPDEIQTLEMLAEAAAQLGGKLTPHPDGSRWELSLPGAGRLAVRLTGEASFPLVLSSAGWPGLLLGGADQPAALKQALADWCAASHRPLDLAELVRPLAGWRAVSTSAAVVDLVRVDQAARGWPAWVQLKLTGGAALLLARQVFAPPDPPAAWAIRHYLASLNSRVVSLQIKEGTPHEPADPFSLQIQYQLSLPAGWLSARHVEAALALLGKAYQEHAPALEGLAAHSTLTRAYILCHRAG